MHESRRQQPFKVDKYTDYAAMAIDQGVKAARSKAEREARENGAQLPDDWGKYDTYFAVLPDTPPL